jgi:uncharacterized protein YegP (UPF0339 family)
MSDGTQALAERLHGFGFDCVPIIRDDVTEPTHLQQAAAAAILADGSVYLSKAEAERLIEAVRGAAAMVLQTEEVDVEATRHLAAVMVLLREALEPR